MVSGRRLAVSGWSPEPLQAAAGRVAASRRAFTLVEVLVVLAIVAITASLVGLSVASLDPPAETDIPARVADARAEAIRTVAPVVLEFAGGVKVTLRPDGSASPALIAAGDLVWRVNPWTGEVHRE